MTTGDRGLRPPGGARAPRPWSSERRSPPTTDIVYGGHIRVAFDLQGYWSLVGRASRVRDVAGPHEASMSLGGFGHDMPEEWDSIVLHEFGHALGFEHEHQHPGSTCLQELKWEPDPGYVMTTDEFGTIRPDGQGRSPGVKLHFGGPPNEWTESEIRENIEAIRAEVVGGKFDSESVMKYYFPDWLFVDPGTSDCFNEVNRFLSSGDREGVLCFYSRSRPEHCPEEATGFTLSAADATSWLQSVEEDVPSDLIDVLEDQTDALQEMNVKAPGGGSRD